MLNMHPLLVHFPIALLISAFALEVLGLVLRSDRLRHAGAINLILGALGGVAAAVTGLIAERSMSAGDAAIALARTHKTLTLLALGMAVPLAAWRVWSRDQMSPVARIVFLTLMFAMLVLLATGAHSGGRLVYDFGAGASLMGAAYE